MVNEKPQSVLFGGLPKFYDHTSQARYVNENVIFLIAYYCDILFISYFHEFKFHYADYGGAETTTYISGCVVLHLR